MCQSHMAQMTDKAVTPYQPERQKGCIYENCKFTVIVVTQKAVITLIKFMTYKHFNLLNSCIIIIDSFMEPV